MTEMKLTGKHLNKPSSTPVIILAHSAAWQSALKRAILSCPTVWALDENDLVTEAIQHPRSAIVVEIASLRADRIARWKPLFSPRRRLFVVGDGQIRSAQGRLRELGVVDIFDVPSDLGRLVKMLDLHNDKFPGPPVSLESEIQRQLPWS